MNVHPLIFHPMLKEKVWGGHRLSSLGKRAPGDLSDQPIGESWEIADLVSTSPSGGGGEPAHSVIGSGPLRGKTIRDAIKTWGKKLMGDVPLTDEGGFPLLVKFLDADENLSVQTHPSRAYAQEHPDAHLKTESWYVIDAEEDAVIYKGVREGVTAEQFRRHIEDGSVVEDLIAIPAKPGDFHNLPSGTVHALGRGVMVAEVQTPSDTTFRVFDWGRTGRELHIEQAMECIDFSPPEQIDAIRHDEPGRKRLVETEYFTIDQVNKASNDRVPVDTEGKPVVWICISGRARLAPNDGSFNSIDFRAGTTLLLPAAMSPGVCASKTPIDPLRILEVRFPEG